MHFLDERRLRWDLPETRQLRDLLAEMYPRRSEVEDLVSNAQDVVRVYHIKWGGSTYDAWRDVMNQLHRAMKLHALLTAVLGDPSRAQYHDALQELLGPSPLIASGRPAADDSSPDFTWHGGASEEGLERLTAAGRTLLEASFLERGYQVAAAVAYLEVRFEEGRRRMKGTGFLIGPDLLLTCHHVLHDWDRGVERASSVEVRFGYELDGEEVQKPWRPVAGLVDTIQGDRALDWAVLRLEEAPGDEYPPLMLKPLAMPAVDERAYIVQHPDGQPKKVALDGNLVRYVGDDVIQYLTETQEGSSGAPVFDREWQVVALHQKWARVRWGETTVYHNQGTRMDRILESMGEKGVLYGEDRGDMTTDGDGGP